MFLIIQLNKLIIIMGFDSNPRCLDKNCVFNCCDINGICPPSPSLCHYTYNSYYCYNNCTSQYYYSSSICNPNCTYESSWNQGLIYGCIFGSFFFILIVSSLILYKCNKRNNEVTAQGEVQVDQANHSSNLDDNSLSTINDGELHSVMNKKQAKDNNGNRSESKIVEKKQEKQKKTDRKKTIQKKRVEKQKEESIKKQQLKPTYGKLIPLSRKAMLPDFSF